jgi:hypothetical protein
MGTLLSFSLRAIVGTNAFVVGRGALSLVAFVTATLPCGHAAAQCVTGTLNPPNGREIDGFGIKGALQGNRLVVGNIAGPIGYVQLYDRVDGEWQLTGEIIDPHLEPDSGFANHPTLRGNRLLLTADDSTGTARQEGAVYEFSLDGARARLVQELRPPPRSEDASFGYSISQDGGRLAIGAPGLRINELDNVGAVFVYARDESGAWALEQRIDSPVPIDPQSFATDVELSAGRLFVAHPLVQEAYEYRRVDGAWQRTHTFETTFFDQSFGMSLAASPTLLVVGSPLASAGSLSGTATAFRLVDGAWSAGTLLTPPQNYVMLFGWEVAVVPSNETILVSAIDYNGYYYGSGAVFLYRRALDGWAPPETILPDSAAPTTGDSIQVDGDRAFVGQIGTATFLGGLLELDCNMNGVPDACDIAEGTSTDVDDDGVPDECLTPADLDTDGDVDATDVALLLGAWGPCLRCGADIDRDGIVAAPDLAILLASW